MATVAKISDLKIGDVVSWSHYGNAVASITDGEVIGFTSGKYLGDERGQIAIIRHSNTYPSIPQSSVIIPDDFTAYDYIIVRKLIGVVGNVPQYENWDIGIPWIVPVSVMRQSRGICTIQIEDFDEDSEQILHRILKNNGFKKYTISVN